MGNVSFRGSVEIGSDCGGGCGGGCGGCGGGADRTVRTLGPQCSRYYQTVVSTGAPIRVQTPGAVGDAYVDLDLLADLIAIEFLFLKSDAACSVRLNAAAARIIGTTAVFPTGFVGGETLTLTIDGTAVSVAFLVGDQSAAQVVARINAACALAGLPTPRASVATNGQIQLNGVLTGPQGSIVITGGTGATTIGLVGRSAIGSGADIPVNGTLLLESPTYPNAPTRIQVSGNASLTIVAAGRTAP